MFSSKTSLLDILGRLNSLAPSSYDSQNCDQILLLLLFLLLKKSALIRIQLAGCK